MQQKPQHSHMCRCNMAISYQEVGAMCTHQQTMTCTYVPGPGFTRENPPFNSLAEPFLWSVIRNVLVTPTPSIFPKVLPYKWGAYCRTNGRRTAGFPFLRSSEARKVPFESKLLPAVLLFLRINFPEITVTVTVLKFR